MHQFNEHHSKLKGFSVYFAEQLLPYLDSLEHDRRERLIKFNTLAAVMVVTGLIVATTVFRKEGELGIYMALALILGIAYFAFHEFTFKEVTVSTKAHIVGGVCHYVGWTFSEKPTRPDLELWSSLLLIPQGYTADDMVGSQRTFYEDQVSGQANGAFFQSIEVAMVRKSGDSSVTDFHGQLMSVTFPRKFLGRTIVLRNKGILQGKNKSNMKRVGLVDPVFKKIFQAYGTDQVEARYLLTPTFMQRLVDLEQSVDGKNIRFGFDKNKLFIAVETANQFEAGPMNEPLTNPPRTQKILNEIGTIYNIIDAVMERPLTVRQL